MNKCYSKINQIPTGHATMSITEGCVVCEGGAFRAVYGEGVLDALMENDINMQCTVGVSAGAMNGLNYVSGQIGRAARFNLNHRFDRNYVAGPKTLVHNKGLIGFDFVLGDVREEPFDDVFFNRKSRRYVAVVTNLEDGKAYYMDRDSCSDILQAIRASASMPFVSAPVMVEGMPCLDGGCAEKIPVEWALNEGYEKIIIIKTQHKDFRRDENEAIDPMIDMVYHKYNAFTNAFKTSNTQYNRVCDRIDELERQGRVFVFSPSIDDPAGRLENDIEKLGDWYFLGYNDAMSRMDELKAYLQSDTPIQRDEKEERPYITCHMTTSIDGKVTGDYLSSPTGIKASEVYYRIHKEMDAQGFACGRVTMETSFTNEERVNVASYLPVESLEDYVDSIHPFYAISFDQFGKVGWTSSCIHDEDPGYDQAHIIEVVCEQVDLSYLAYLQSIHVSYIIAGKEEIDIHLALTKLRKLFGIHHLLLEGGSILNGSFFKEDVIDELSIVQANCLCPNGKSLMSQGDMKEFKMYKVTPYDDCIWLQYKRV